MFRYANAKALALHNNCAVKVDITFYNTYSAGFGGDDKRKYELDIFEESIEIASKYELAKIAKFKYNNLFKGYNRSRKILGLQPAFVFCQEKHFLKLDRSILNQTGKLFYLEGDRQNELYFSDVSDSIRNAFLFKNINADKVNYNLGMEMNDGNSISLHIRRGDYVNHAYNNPCSIEYYKKSIEFINSKVDAPRFYIFSDDLEWVKNNLTIKESHVFVDINTGVESYKDMYLMSRCKHNIIANSSFS